MRRAEIDVSARRGERALRIEARLEAVATRPAAIGRLRLTAPRRVSSVVLDGLGRRFSHGDGLLRFRHEDVAAETAMQLSIAYTWPLNRPVEEMEALFGHSSWYPLGEDGRTGSSRVTVTLPAALKVLSVGARVRQMSEGVQRVTFTTPTPQRALPLVVGRFRESVSHDGERVATAYLPETLAGLADLYAGYLLEAADFFRATLGPLPRRTFDLVALPLGRGLRGATFPGLTIFNSKGVRGGEEFPARILAHEIAHNWWSHSVRFPRPEDAWLAEGLPTYTAILLVEHRDGARRLREELANSRRIALSSDDPRPLALVPEGPERYTQSYHKAALVLHMLRVRMGRESFLDMLRELHESHRGGSAGRAELEALVVRRASFDVPGFFGDWVDSAAVPRFELSYGVRRGKSCEVAGTLEQRGASVTVPLTLRLNGPSGDVDHTVVATPGRSRFRLACSEPPVRVSVDPGGDVLSRGIEVRERRP